MNKRKEAIVFSGAMTGTLRYARDNYYRDTERGYPVEGDTVVLESKDERVVERFNGDEWVEINLEAHELPEEEGRKKK